MTKAGKDTHGVDRFFSSLAGKPVPGLAFFTLSLISTKQRRSFPIRVEQVIRPVVEVASAPAPKRKPGRPKKDATASVPSAPAPKRKPGRPKKDATAPAPSEPAPKRKPGRPKGRKTGAHVTTPSSPEWQRIGTMIGTLLCRMGGVVPLTYVVLDGHFGNAPALQMVRRHRLHLISRLRADSGLYLPYAGRGPQRKYGDKIDDAAIPERFLRQTTVEGKVETRVYQAEVWLKTFPPAPSRIQPAGPQSALSGTQVCRGNY